MFRLIGSQFRKPSGFLGKIISKIMTKGNIPDYDKMIPELNIQQNDKILEIGYGRGLGVFRILTEYDCHVTGIDFSDVMFKAATKINKKFIDNGKAGLNYGDFLEMEITPGLFDKVFCLHVIYFWDNLLIPFSRILTILKEGGAFCTFMANIDYMKKVKFTKDGIFNKYSIDKVVGDLNSTGFKNITYSTFDKGYIINCNK